MILNLLIFTQDWQCSWKMLCSHSRYSRCCVLPFSSVKKLGTSFPLSFKNIRKVNNFQSHRYPVITVEQNTSVILFWKGFLTLCGRYKLSLYSIIWCSNKFQKYPLVFIFCILKALFIQIQLLRCPAMHAKP